MQNLQRSIDRAKSSQPDYWDLGPKIKAREENVHLYRRLTQTQTIPLDRGYWTLANLQPPDKEGSEIVQISTLGLITSPAQFYGVDWDKNKIAQNKLWHPNANWFDGQWTEVIREQEFNPGMIYLDTTNFADHRPAAKMVGSTMYLCRENTVLLANLMLNDPRSHLEFDPAGLIRLLEKSVASFELKKWHTKVENYVYNGSGKTNMITYAFHKLED